MSLMNQTRLSEIGCCINSKLSNDINDSWKGKTFTACATIDAYKYSILRSYVENGTPLTEGFVASATLDMSAFSAFGSLLGNVVINGVVIGVIPDGTYADIDEVIDAFVTAITSNPIGYQAVNNGNGTITVTAPNAGSQANGFVITIQINPTFARLSQIDYDNRDWRQPIHVNDTTSALYGHTIIASRESDGATNPFQLEDIYNHTANQTIRVDLATGAYALVHRPTDDTVFTGAFQGASSNLEQFDSALQPLQTLTLGGTPGSGWATWNTFNSCLYFANTSSNRITKVDPTGTQTNITGITAVFKMAVDPTTGTVWALGTNSLWRINPTTNIATAIPTVGEIPTSITYSSDSDTMFVTFSTPGVVREYNLDGTVATATFYSLTSCTSIIYSEVYNVLFVGTSSVIHVVKMDGTLKNAIADGCNDFVEDIGRAEVIGVTDSGLGNIGYVNFFGLASDGTDVFDGALEEGVDPVYQTQDMQCLTESQVSGSYQYLDKECGACGGETYSGGVALPPVIGSAVIYYGISTNAALDAAGVSALSTVTQSSIAGTYTYTLGGATNYIYFAYPTSLGIPVRMYDPATNFEIAMEASYEVIINYITYTVYRSYYQLGGGFDMTVTI